MFHVSPDQVVVLCYLGLLAWGACSDAIEFKIPNSASLGLAAFYPIYVLTNPVGVDWPWALAVALAVFVPGLVLFGSGMVGGGDVKFLTATSLWAGPKMILPMILAMSLAGGLLALLIWGGRWFRQLRPVADGDVSLTTAEYAATRRLPYGVAIAAGAGLVGLRLFSG